MSNNFQDSSTVKTFIDNWYNTNLSSYSNYLSDTLFCNDTSFKDVSTLNAYDRLANNYAPIFTCLNQDDRYTTTDDTLGNAKLTYPIGLISGDEMVFAGQVFLKNNYTFYLSSGSTLYWTMTPMITN